MKNFKLKLVTFFLATSIASLGQEYKRITFEDSISWQEVKKKALRENKYIFLDAYATWCGPCKYMDNNILNDSNVVQFINENFVSIKLQMDVTDSDDEKTKSRYSDASKIKSKYQINSFPTYLFFSPGGALVHRFIGATKQPHEFISRAANALYEDKQYYSIVNEFTHGRSDSAFLLTVVKAARSAGDKATGSAASKQYIRSLKDPYQKFNCNFIFQRTRNTTDAGFDIIMQNPRKVDQIMGTGAAKNKLKNIICGDIVRELSEAKNPPNWNAIKERLTQLYPSIIDEAVMQFFKVRYYYQKVRYEERHREDVQNYLDNTKSYIEQLGDSLTNAELNSYAWTTLLISNDRSVLLTALKWSEKTLSDDTPNVSYYLDTYANIAYKLGDVDKAKMMEKKALQAAISNGFQTKQLEVFQEVLERMKKGLPTDDLF